MSVKNPTFGNEEAPLKITEDQKEELEELLQQNEFEEFNAKCEEYGIELEAKPYTGYQFYYSDGDFIGDCDDTDLKDALKAVGARK